MFSAVIHDYVEEDLDSLFIENRAASIIVGQFLEQIETDFDLLDKMTVHKFKDEDIDVEHFAEQWDKRKRNLWRLKLTRLVDINAPFRIIYAFHPDEHRYYILGVVKRDFDYSEKDPRTQRIIRAYNELGIPEH